MPREKAAPKVVEGVKELKNGVANPKNTSLGERGGRRIRRTKNNNLDDPNGPRKIFTDNNDLVATCDCCGWHPHLAQDDL